LNIAEGSTGQSDAEQNRFLGLALRPNELNPKGLFHNKNLTHSWTKQ
jgi:hypothetical protein